MLLTLWNVGPNKVHKKIAIILPVGSLVDWTQFEVVPSKLDTISDSSLGLSFASIISSSTKRSSCLMVERGIRLAHSKAKGTEMLSKTRWIPLLACRPAPEIVLSVDDLCGFEGKAQLR